MTVLRDLLDTPQPDIKAIEAHLDALPSDQRVTEVRQLGRRQLSKLYAAAKGHRPVSLGDIVPPSQAPMSEVVHYGKNSLGAFTHFAKVFVRPNGTEAKDVLWGYNRSGDFLETTVGPGYFVTHAHDVPGELLVDYLQIPPAKPDHWPEILPNSARLSFFVYNGTQDILRGVSKHVTIGRATKKGKEMSAWFALCRAGD